MPDLIAADLASKTVKGLARRVAMTDATVLLCGASGAGKEIYAKYIHSQSPRRDAPFVAVNCAAIPDNMLEAMLFGHEKGAFTGAVNSHSGKFEQAQGGTLLLDEVSEMDLALQAKLLRVLQEREVERLGSRKTIDLDVRVIATTNRDLKAAVQDGLFREDLFYRLNVFPLYVPRLAERPGDILPLAEHFLLRQPGVRHPAAMLSDAAKSKLCSYDWPGNVRELDNVIQRAMILRQDTVLSDDDIQFEIGLNFMAAPTQAQEEHDAGNHDDMPLSGLIRDQERLVINDALRRGKSKKEAAEILGISPRTLRYKMARLREHTAT